MKVKNYQVDMKFTALHIPETLLLWKIELNFIMALCFDFCGNKFYNLIRLHMNPNSRFALNLNEMFTGVVCLFHETQALSKNANKRLYLYITPNVHTIYIWFRPISIQNECWFPIANSWKRNLSILGIEIVIAYLSTKQC